MKLESKAPSIPFKQYAYNETRYRMLTKSHPEAAKKLLEQAQQDVNEKWQLYSGMANLDYSNGDSE